MQIAKGLIILLIAVIVISCFYPWVTIESKNIVVTGFASEGTNFGKPAIFHLFLCLIYLLFISLRSNWSKRAAFFISGFNIAWAIRNFIVISTCNGGICPTKHAALYILLASSLLILILTLFVKAEDKENTNLISNKME
ncbi:MAG TPA: hypothetical protein VGO09_00670 [Flavisolibacter sp.]|nr:hypothetical protein [Flavisolibacter sp.]